MPRVDYKTCEPFRAWNRLEPRPRKYDFDRALKSEVHDPLWYLTRQWQFGEFKGEDTGSPIMAKVLIETTRLAKFKAFQAGIENYSDAIPLEAVVERAQLNLGYKERVQAGNYWLRIMDYFGQEYNKVNTSNLYDPAVYKAKILNLYPLTLSESTATDVKTAVHNAQLHTNQALVNYVATFTGKVPDGVLIYEAIKTNKTAFVNQLRELLVHRFFLKDAADDFETWFERLFPEAEEVANSWNVEKLEYNFACALPDEGNQTTVLRAEEYYSGKLDWFSFDVDSVPETALTNIGSAQREALIEQEVLSFIPTPAEFAGMPSSRWWEFEDGNVDLGNINAGSTDLSKIVVAEFATIYGNNWFIVPYDVPVGTLSEVKGIVVTDVFGQKTLVEPAIQGQSSDWAGWGMFNLTKRKANAYETADADTRLLIPPALPKIQESEPVEEVLLVRDEMANLVWAIETKVDNLMKMGMDGHAAGIELSNYLNTFFDVENLSPEVTDGATLKYVLGNTVPENWIPFISVHVGNDNRAIQLQRASMPRLINEEQTPIRPRTQLMRSGFAYDPSTEIAPYINPDSETQLNPYYVNEEEILRTGIKLSGTLQRARWYDGKIVKWYGYRKTLGRGEGSSGLRYDKVEFTGKK